MSEIIESDSNIIDDVCFMCARYKKDIEVLDWFKENYEEEVSMELIKEVRLTHKKEINSYRQGGSDSIQKGIQLGTLPSASLYNRIATLNDIIRQCVEGYAQEKVNGRGEIVYETVKNFGAAISAVSLMSNLMQQLPKEEDYYEIILGEIDSETKTTVKRLALPPANYG
jgi:hypothetical protein